MNATVEQIGQATFLCYGDKRQYLCGNNDGVNTETVNLLKEIIVDEYSSRAELEDAIDDAINASDSAEALYFDWENK